MNRIMGSDDIFGEIIRGFMSSTMPKQRESKIKYTVSRSSVLQDLKRRSKQPRNELCNCGSGLKYKKCHGKIINEEG